MRRSKAKLNMARGKVQRRQWQEKVEQHLEGTLGLRERNLFKNIVLFQQVSIPHDFSAPHRSSSVDVLSITIADAPVIAISIASSFNGFPKASLCRVPPKHSGKNHLKGLKRRSGTMWFVIFIFLVDFQRFPFRLRRYRSFCCASWLP
jgi:hypothetical protein